MYITWSVICITILCLWGKCQSNSRQEKEEEATQAAFRAKVVNPLIKEVSVQGEPATDEISPFETEELLSRLRHFENSARNKHEEGTVIYTDIESKQGSELPEKELKQWHAGAARVSNINDELAHYAKEAQQTHDSQIQLWEKAAAEDAEKSKAIAVDEQLENKVQNAIKKAQKLFSGVQRSETARLGYSSDIKKLKRNLNQLRRQNAEKKAHRAKMDESKAIVIGEDNHVNPQSVPIVEARALLEKIKGLRSFDTNILTVPTLKPAPLPEPFRPDVHIVTTGDLSSTLLEPLVEAWLKDRKATPLNGNSFMWDMPDEQTRELEARVPASLQGKDAGILRIRISTENNSDFIFKHIRHGKGDANLVLTGRKMNILEEKEWLPLNETLSSLDPQTHGRTYRARLCSDALLFFRGNAINTTSIRQSDLRDAAKVFSCDDKGRAEVASIFGLTPSGRDITDNTKNKSIRTLAEEHSSAIILGNWHNDSMSRTGSQAMSVAHNPTLSYAAGMDAANALKNADKRFISLDDGCAPSEETINSGQYAFSYNITFYRATENQPQAQAAADLMQWAVNVNNKQTETLVRSKGYVPVQAVKVYSNSKITNADLPLDMVLQKLESRDFGYTRGVSTWVYGSRISIPLYYEVGSDTANSNGVAIDPDSQYYTEKQALQIIRELVANGNACLVLVGHADPQWGKKLNVSKESWNGNMSLSNKRAAGVYASLFQKAFPDSATLNHITLGCSWARPASDISLTQEMERQEHALSRCRRVEVFVVFPLTSESSNN